MGTMWYEMGEPPIEGRIVGYLMLSNAPHVSSAELIEVLQTSAATISTTTRRLADVGFIRRVSVPGQRGNHFRVEDDIWGAFLAGERKYLGRRSQFASEILEKLGSDDATLRRRVENMRDYMTWLATYHRKMLDDWEQVKRERDAHNPS
jgi:DNA-binding transcriptional regulator GbsR (MarR family)